VLRTRKLYVRAYDNDDIIDAEVCDGNNFESLLRQMLSMDAVA
jgi:hypothetical protein